MKNLFTVCLISLLTAAQLHAQKNEYPVNEPDYNKPKQFQNFTQKIAIPADVLSSVFTIPVGRQTGADSSSASSFPFAGQLISTVSKYENRIISAVIRLNNFPDTYFTVSKITGENGSISYTGQVICKGKGDAYVLQQENGLFSLTKKNYPDLVVE
jgi:hypothetical protein